MSERKKDKEERLYSQTQLAKELRVSQSTITRLIRDSEIKPVKKSVEKNYIQRIN